jgi:eukaryotic-like serine/threonine-protein kinase
VIGETVASYKITRKLGEGGMGEVYLAEHRYIARRAAIKFLLRELSSSESVVNRFFTEARAASLIQHPGIIEVQDCGIHTDGRAYMVMEFLNGESVRGYLDRAGKLTSDPEAALAICAQVAGALAAAHAQSIVHRDLKPDNIFLHLPAGRQPAAPVVKVLDFGIAKLLGGGAAGTNTRTGNLLGTPLYMSPEQCRGAGEIDSRSDIYSFGCIMFELLCGRPPFVYEGLGELIYAHISQPPPDPVGVSPAAREILLACLAKDPKQRPQTMDALGGMLASAGALPFVRLKVPVALAAGLPASPALSPAPLTPAPARAADTGGAAVRPSGLASAPVAATSAAAVPPGPVTAAQASVSAGGTQVMPSQTTFTQTAGEVVEDRGPARGGGRKLVFAGVGAAAAITIVAVALSRGGNGKSERSASPAASEPAPHAAVAPP